VTEIVFLASLAALPILGLALSPWLEPLPSSGSARLAVFTASGAVLLSAEMLLCEVAGVRWSIPLLLAPVVLIPFVRPKSARPRLSVPREAWPALAVVILELAIVAFLAATARATSNDYIYFWGTKGELFAMARGIDQQILRYVHSDYPPLLSFLYAWGALVARGFSWMAGPVYLPIFLGLGTCAVWGFARDAMAPRRAAQLTAIYVGLLGYGMTFNDVGGGGEAPLLFFETLALAALMLGRGADAVAGVALAAAIWTKSEGSAMAFLLLATFGFLRWREGRAGRFLRDAALLPIAAQAAWYFFCRMHGLLRWFSPQTVSTVRPSLLPGVLREMLANAGFGAFYLPWIVVAILIAGGRVTRVGIAAAAAAAGFILFLSFIYMHGERVPVWMIRWSVSRAILAPLLCFFFFAAVSGTAARKTSIEFESS
jgi:hypothetical protein